MTKHIASFSGGKDSTAMVLRLIELGEPLDEVLFCDTGKDFPAMYDHISKIKGIVEETGIKFTKLKGTRSFDYLMFEHSPKRKSDKYKGLKGRSWANLRNRWCTGDLKIKVIKHHIGKIAKDYSVYQYIGIAADEIRRLEKKNNKDQSHIHPLVDWGWDEKRCLNYCYKKGFDWDGLYELFDRVSCWCCPLQGLDDLRKLRTNFPELWEELRDMDSRTWRTFRPDYSVEQLEIRFELEEERIKSGLTINPYTNDFRMALKQRFTEREGCLEKGL